MNLSLSQLKFDGLLFLANRIVARIPSHSIRLLFYRYVMDFPIGASSYIFMDAWFDCRGSFTCGHHSVINQKCRLDNRGGLTIGDHASISSEVCILTADHDPASPQFAGRHRPVRISSYTFIGTRAIILPGVTIGEGAIVAAGAVVTKDVAPFQIVAGSPAREIGTRNRELDYTVNYCRLFF